MTDDLTHIDGDGNPTYPGHRERTDERQERDVFDPDAEGYRLMVPTDERQAGLLREALSQDNPARLVVWRRNTGWLREDEAFDAIMAALAVAQVPAQERAWDYPASGPEGLYEALPAQEERLDVEGEPSPAVPGWFTDQT